MSPVSGSSPHCTPTKACMAMSNYLRREIDSFIFRRRVPAPLQARIGQAEIYRSLKTTVRRVAKARAAHLFIATERLFTMAEEQDDYLVTDADIRAAVRSWLNTTSWTSRLERHVDGITPGALRAYHQTLPDMLLAMTADEGVSHAHNVAMEAEAALEHADYIGQGRGETLRKTEAVLRRQLREYVDRRMQTVFEDGIAFSTPDQSVPSAPQPVKNMARLSTFLEPWQKDIIAGYDHGDGLADETTDQYLQTVEMFIGLIGDIPVGTITFERAAEFRELCLQMPATHGKGAICSPKAELARARKDKTIPRLTMTTAKRHFSGMNSIWKWLIFKKHVPAADKPFSGHKFPGTKRKKSNRRQPWSELAREICTARISGISA